MALPASAKPVWRVVQVVYTARGLDDGLRLFIVGPFLYELLSLLFPKETALFYTSVLWAIYFAAITILEIPTGALADILGRARMAILSLLLNSVFALGMLLLPFIKIPLLVVCGGVAALVVRALAFTLMNGTMAAWIVDRLKEVAPEVGYERLLARSYACHSWASIVGGLLGVALYLHGLAALAFITGALICICAAVYCAAEMTEPRAAHYVNLERFFPSARQQITNKIRTGLQCCRETPVLWWILITCAAYNFLMNAIDFLWPITMGTHFGKEKWSIEWYGLVLAIPLASAIGSQLLSWQGDRSERTTGIRIPNATLRYWLSGNFLLSSIPIILLSVLNRYGLMKFPHFAIAIVLMGYTAGSAYPVFSTLANNYIPDHNAQQRATILSIGSMVRGLLMLFLLIPSSGSSGTASPSGWIIPAVILLVAGIMCHRRLKQEERSAPRALPFTAALAEGESA